MSEDRKKYTVAIESEETRVEAIKGDTIRAALNRAGIYFPQNCGGKGQCGCCRVEFKGKPPQLRPRERELLGQDSIYRLSCLHKVNSDITISLPLVQEWLIEKNIRGFDFAGMVCDEYGIAIDLGTTIVALYLVDFKRGQIAAQYSFLNPQVHLGADVMTRLDLAKDEARRKGLTEAIRKGIGAGISSIIEKENIPCEHITNVFLVGNTPMIHLFLGRAGEGLEVAPFRSPLERHELIAFPPELLGLPNRAICEICPIIQGFIGGDTTAAIISVDLDRTDEPRLLIDLGTNGEIVIAAKGAILAASTAAGPAFEGVGLRDGMPAHKGAIEGFDESGAPFVIGGGEPLGFCGSGYISAMALMRRKELLNHTGLLEKDAGEARKWSPLPGANGTPVITQDDVRKFQLAKGAIAAGIEILCENAGIEPRKLKEIIITGSFGNRIDPQATMEVGLIPQVSLHKVTFLDNAAGRGAVLCLGNAHFKRRAKDLQRSVKAVNLAEHPDFQDIFVEHMGFK